MYVPSYQMHNVLHVYSKQLMQNIHSVGEKSTLGKPREDKLSLTLEGKRQTTIDKVSKDIFDKITRFGSQAESQQRISDQIKGKPDKERASAKMDKAGFVFNVIDTINKKTTNTVSVEDSNFLIQRLDQLAKGTKVKRRNSGFEDQGKISNPAI